MKMKIKMKQTNKQASKLNRKALIHINNDDDYYYNTNSG